MTLPHVAVLRDKFLTGLNSFAEAGEMPLTMTEVLPLDAALQRSWGTDAHFVTYLPFEGGSPAIGDPFPRLNKAILGEVRERGGDICTTMLVVDWDLPGHVAWEEGQPDAFVAQLPELYEAGLPRPTFFYTTRGGARWVYVLARPIPADLAELKMRGMVAAFQALGLDADPLDDWTRLFRLPRVMREGEATGDAPYFRETSHGPLIDPDSVESRGTVARTKTGTVPRSTLPQPTPEEAMVLLERKSDATGRMIMTGFLKTARRLLIGRDCYGPLFDDMPVGERGERDRQLMRLVGECTTLLHGEIGGLTRAHIYALFLPAAEQMEPDEGTPDWTAKLWYCVCYCWDRAEAASRADAVQQERRAEQRQDLVTRMAYGMAEWCDRPELKDPESDAAKLFVLRHTIAAVGRSYYVMRPDGYYDGMPMIKDHVPLRLRELGLGDLISLEELQGNVIRPRPIQNIISEHATVVGKAVGSLQHDDNVILDIEQKTSRLVMSLFQLRTDLEPTFDERVHEWMGRLVGDRLDEFIEWLQWALAFRQGPICALALTGAASVGKKMLVHGLAETITTGVLAQGLDIVASYKDALLETCFLSVDEGLPGHMPGGMDIADAFRTLVTGSDVVVNRKYLAPVTVHNPMRVIFTANNTDVIRQLYRHRSLTPEDQMAFGERLKHFEASERAAIWLRRQGGLRFTKGWIRGDSGEPSEYVLARHLLWLYQRRATTPPGSRLLVEGSMDQPFLADMRTQSGAAPAVIEALVHMIESTSSKAIQSNQGLSLEDGIYATTAGVVRWLRDHHLSSGTPRTITTSQVAVIFQSLQDRDCPTNPTTRVTQSGMVKRARWWKLNATILLHEALQCGYTSERLEAIVRAENTPEAQRLLERAP